MCEQGPLTAMIDASEQHGLRVEVILACTHGMVESRGDDFNWRHLRLLSEKHAQGAGRKQVCRL